MNRRISPSDSRGWCPDTITSVTAIAPALMNGLRGTPRSRSSWTIELNGLPEGSRPTRRHSRSPIMPSASVRVNTFEMLWIENGVSASPPAATRPSASITAMPKAVGVDRARVRECRSRPCRGRCAASSRRRSQETTPARSGAALLTGVAPAQIAGVVPCRDGQCWMGAAASTPVCCVNPGAPANSVLGRNDAGLWAGKRFETYISY